MKEYMHGISGHVRKGAIVISVLALVVVILYGRFSTNYQMNTGFHSSEVQFADNSIRGLSIVPASCPSSPHYVGQCSTSSGCPDGYTLTAGVCVITSCPNGFTLDAGRCYYSGGSQCSQQAICFRGDSYQQNSNCSLTLIQKCPYACSASTGACSVPSASVVTWQVAPSLVRSGNTATVTWDVINVQSCTVTGSNGDSWNTVTGAKVSTITERTIFTLSCTALSGGVPATVTQSAIVNIAPVFHEQ